MIGRRSLSQGVNLRKLKIGIDIKFQAILRYLQNEGNVSSSKISDNVGQKTEKESTVANRESINTDFGFDQPKGQTAQSLLFEEKAEKILVNDYLQKQRQEIQKRQQLPVGYRLTPIKTTPEELANGSNSSKSQQSMSRKNIEENVDQKIFGVPLTTSFNINSCAAAQAEPELFSMKLENIQFKAVASGGNTARSKKSKGNKQNQDRQTPGVSLSKEKHRLTSKKTPHKTPHSNHHYSTAKRLFEYFSGFERESRPITQQMFHKMKEEVEQLYKQTRKEGQDNNVRQRLLKRIEGIKNKPNEFHGK